MLVNEFSIRKGSGGKGKWRGGDGLIRSFTFLRSLQVSILSERRVFEPFGLEGGENGKRGFNYLIKKDGTIFNIGGKNTIMIEKDEKILILTPGGGGYGSWEGEESGETIQGENNSSRVCSGSLFQYINDQYTN